MQKKNIKVKENSIIFKELKLLKRSAISINDFFVNVCKLTADEFRSKEKTLK